MERSMYLDMGYASMWSLLDEVSTEELQAEVESVNKQIKELNNQIYALESKTNNLYQNGKVLKQTIKNRQEKIRRDKFVLSSEHKKILSETYFMDGVYKLLEYRELAKVLGWKLPNDDISDEQRLKLDELILELPYAIKELLQSK